MKKPIIFFIYVITKIKSYIPNSEKIQLNGDEGESINIRDSCTCDITKGICDRNCCCDRDCDFKKYGFFDEIIEECLPSNVIQNDGMNAVPICSSDFTVIGDLFNPLSVGYQLLKKGLCLRNPNTDFDLDSVKNPEKEIQNMNFDNDDTQINEDNLNDNFINNVDNTQTVYGNINENVNQIIPNFIFPVMSPSGLCMKGFPIKILNDKIVTCSFPPNGYKNEIHNSYIPKEFFTNVKYYLIDNYIMKEESEEEAEAKDIIYKKIELNIRIRNNEIDISNSILSIYYENFIGSINLIEVTFIVQFEIFNMTLNENEVYLPKKSGNPGYLIGSPIKFGQYNNQYDYVSPYQFNRLFLGVDQKGKCIQVDQNEDYYEDLVLSNTITFENRTLFGCLREENNDNTNYLLPNKIKEYLNLNNQINNRIAFFGNPSVYPNDYFEPDNSQCNYNEITVYYMLIKFLYINVGIKDNPQRRIVRVECQSFSKNDDLNNDSIYLEILFIQYDGGLKTKEAKAPSIFVLPKNVLYPFRFGTTNYEE